MAMLAAKGNAGADPLQMMVGAQGSGRLDAQDRRAMVDAADQYSHFRGQVYTSVRPIAQTIAGQPIRLARVTKNLKGKQQRMTEARQGSIPEWVTKSVRTKANESIEIVDQHPILDALHDPAPSLPGWTDWHLKYVIVASMELTGRAYIWLPVVDGRRELWNCPSNWLRPKETPGKLFDGWILRAEYTCEERELAADDVVPFWYPDPANPLHALGPMEAGARGILCDEYVQTAIKNTFLLGPHPSVLVTLGSKLTSTKKSVKPWVTEAQMAEFRESFNRRYRGMTHYGEPLFQDGKIEKVEAFGRKPNEMDFGMNSDKSQARVEQTFGTNPYIAGAASLGSRAEAAEARKQFVRGTINPKIELISRVLNNGVLPHFDTSGQFVLFVEPAQANDDELDQKEWATASKQGIVTIDEFRAHRLRLPPLPNGAGQQVLIPTTSAFNPLPGLVPEDPEVTAERVAEGDEADGDIDNDDGDETDKSGSHRAGRKHGRKVFDDAFYKDYVGGWLKAHGSHETSLSSAVLAFLNEQGNDVAKQLEATYGDMKGFHELRTKATATAMAANVFTPAAWDEKLKDVVRGPLAYAAAAGASMELASFGQGEALPPPADAPAALGKATDADTGGTPGMSFDFGVDLPADVKQGIERSLNESLAKGYWAGVNVTTLEKLQLALQDGLDAGKTLRELVADVKDGVFEGTIAKERATTIARTETTMALNSGADVAGNALAADGIITGKEWSSAHDTVTRPDHVEADGQRVGADEDFTVGGEKAAFPGDSRLSTKERANCRCVRVSTTAFDSRSGKPLWKGLGGGCQVHGKAV
ncbi:MAG TPA: phage portal protein [Pirellulales bacterium]|nr:phage portal protein [Pirellulales bacterium]